VSIAQKVIDNSLDDGIILL